MDLFYSSCMYTTFNIFLREFYIHEIVPFHIVKLTLYILNLIICCVNNEWTYFILYICSSIHLKLKTHNLFILFHLLLINIVHMFLVIDM